MQKALLLVQDVETKLNSTYLRLNSLEKFKNVSRTTWLATKLNPKGESILTCDKFKLVSLFNELCFLYEW